jgi:hypothetical protein
MRKIIAAKSHTLISLPNEELVTLAKILNEVLNNSDIAAQECRTRIGVSLEELRRIHDEMKHAVAAAGSDAFEIFEAKKEGFSIQLRAVSALGAPADLSYDGVVRTISTLQDDANNA